MRAIWRLRGSVMFVLCESEEASRVVFIGLPSPGATSVETLAE